MDRKLYIEFTRPVGKMFPIFSWLVRAIEGVKYSHVRLAWVNSTNRKVIYEASGSGVKFIGTISQLDHPVEVIDSFEIDITRDEYRALIDICMTYANISYSMKQIIGIGLTYLPFVKKNPFADGRYSQVCSELAGLVLETVKSVDIKEDLDIAGPKKINEVLTNINRPDFRKGRIKVIL